MEFLLGLSWPSSSPCGHLGRDSVIERLLSLSFPLPLCLSSKKKIIKKKKKKKKEDNVGMINGRKNSPEVDIWHSD